MITEIKQVEAKYRCKEFRSLRLFKSNSPSNYQIALFPNRWLNYLKYIFQIIIREPVTSHSRDTYASWHTYSNLPAFTIQSCFVWRKMKCCHLYWQLLPTWTVASSLVPRLVTVPGTVTSLKFLCSVSLAPLHFWFPCSREPQLSNNPSSVNSVASWARVAEVIMATGLTSD